MPSTFFHGYKWLLAVAVSFAFLHTASAQSKARWEEYRSFDGRFRVLTPGELRHKTDSISTALGSLAYHTFFFQDTAKATENAVYMISYCDYPAGSLHHDSTELVRDFFKATVEESAFSVAGNVSWSNEIRLGQYPGIFWRVDYKDGRAVIKTRAYVVRNRYYTIQAVMRKERSLNAAADKFLESFRLFEQEGAGRG